MCIKTFWLLLGFSFLVKCCSPNHSEQTSLSVQLKESEGSGLKGLMSRCDHLSLPSLEKLEIPNYLCLPQHTRKTLDFTFEAYLNEIPSRCSLYVAFTRMWKKPKNIKPPAVAVAGAETQTFHIHIPDTAAADHMFYVGWIVSLPTKLLKYPNCDFSFALRCEWIIFQTCFKTSFLDLGTHDECFQVKSHQTCCKGGRLFCCVTVRGECELLTVGTRGQPSWKHPLCCVSGYLLIRELLCWLIVVDRCLFVSVEASN